MSQWQVELEGDQADLHLLSQHFQGGGYSLTQRATRYYLDADRFNGLSDASAVYEVACTLVQRMRATINMPLHRPLNIKVGRVSKPNLDGPQQHSIVISNISVSLAYEVVVLPDGTVRGPDGKTILSQHPTASRHRLDVAMKDPVAAKALDLWAEYERTNADSLYTLWKLYEVIRDDLGGGGGTEKAKQEGLRQILDVKKWATREQIKGFSVATNNPKVSGDKARHAVEESIPATITPLSEEESAALVQRLLNDWLDAKP